MRTHTSNRVVNQLSRFHTSAGIEAFPSASFSSSSSSHSSRSTAGSAKGSSQGQSQSPSREAKDASTSSSSVTNYNTAATHSWSNPRDLPLPSPVTVSALQQIKQPYLATTGWYTGNVRVACFFCLFVSPPLLSLLSAPFLSLPPFFPLSPSPSLPPLLPLSPSPLLSLSPFSPPSLPSLLPLSPPLPLFFLSSSSLPPLSSPHQLPHILYQSSHILEKLCLTIRLARTQPESLGTVCDLAS